ncbi:2-haloacid dehalogenase [Rhizobiales bacterium GAS191]|nr:2-haloacid dehalogenase [Rhizobiales bacterium GAS188]SEC87452.1 2-haloacid dehalogenase [Rhizobiales bacterium GAS191]
MIKALFFDVFGTLVDWRSSIAREAKTLLAPLGHDLDYAAFADAWRGEYQPSMEEVRSGRRGYVLLDDLHRENLARILPRFQLQGLSAETREALNRIWHRLDAWADVPEGMRRLHAKYRLAPVSNGNIAIMVDLARHNGIVFDAILGSEIARDYKPNPAAYLASARALGLEPSACAMVAAHSSDLAAAASCGLKTAHVARPAEHGPGTGETKPTVKVDFAARDMGELADILDT